MFFLRRWLFYFTNLLFFFLGGLGCYTGDGHVLGIPTSSCQFGTDPSVGSSSSSSSSSGTGLLYVLDDFTDTVYVFDNIGGLNGTVAASRTINGSETRIVDPDALALDTQRDILYVADSNGQEVLAFVGASQKNGNAPPLRRYPGIKQTAAMFYDLVNDRLYVTDTVDKLIKVWDHISELSDGANASRTIQLDYVPSALTVDSKRNLLYVGDPIARSIKVYPGISTLSGNPSPDHALTHASQNFNHLNGLTMNIDNDILFISESTVPSIEIFDQASTLIGSVSSTRQIKGSNTGMTVNLKQILFLSNVLYLILNDTSVGIWEGVNQLTGDVAPTRTVTLSSAMRIVGMAVDLSR